MQATLELAVGLPSFVGPFGRQGDRSGREIASSSKAYLPTENIHINARMRAHTLLSIV